MTIAAKTLYAYMEYTLDVTFNFNVIQHALYSVKNEKVC